MRSTPNRSRLNPALREGSPPDPGQARIQRRNRLLGGAFTAGVHLTVLAALFWPHAKPPPAQPSLALTLVSIPERPKPEPPGPPAMTEAKADTVRPVPPRLPSPVRAVAPDNSDILSEAQLSGAAGAGEGGANGGGCDLALAVQQALRRDPLVHTALEGANRLGKAVMMWNGDWVRSGSQDGKGLSAVRQAIMWEVAFAPQSCRNERMHRPVLLSLADGNTRLAIGSGDWRWSDLLGVHAGPPSR